MISLISAYLTVSVSGQLEPSRQEQIGHKLNWLWMLKTNDDMFSPISLFIFVVCCNQCFKWVLLGRPNAMMFEERCILVLFFDQDLRFKLDL